jgi:hypothetical protein
MVSRGESEEMMVNRRIRRALDNLGDGEEVLLADGFEAAFVGVARQFGSPIAVYDRKKCLHCLVKQGMSHEEAEEYFSFNTEGAWVGSGTPAFLEL